jgi:hypothetical protein
MHRDDVEINATGVRLHVGSAARPEITCAWLIGVRRRAVHLPHVSGIRKRYALRIPQKTDMLREFAATALEVDAPVASDMPADAVRDRSPRTVRLPSASNFLDRHHVGI